MPLRSVRSYAVILVLVEASPVAALCITRRSAVMLSSVVCDTNRIQCPEECQRSLSVADSECAFGPKGNNLKLEEPGQERF